ncbi:hypothetical protein [Neobacillus cucumis]|uniref:hypothetical protein n=1 Tax=Neobacillus cucumis TaxID=1740721 RepID=UPI002853064A|nr:hypothetical protein [Neobacillus cucumis]MDR4949085.1 hypothetical protein [Neobacillus cucumis]
MNISKNLTQEKLLEILIDSYKKGQEIENIEMNDFIEDIKEKVILVINAKKD